MISLPLSATPFFSCSLERAFPHRGIKIAGFFNHWLDLKFCCCYRLCPHLSQAAAVKSWASCHFTIAGQVKRFVPFSETNVVGAPKALSPCGRHLHRRWANPFFQTGGQNSRGSSSSARRLLFPPSPRLGTKIPESLERAGKSTSPKNDKMNKKGPMAKALGTSPGGGGASKNRRAGQRVCTRNAAA